MDSPSRRYRAGHAGALVLRRHFARAVLGDYKSISVDDNAAVDQFRSLAALADGAITSYTAHLSPETLQWIGLERWRLVCHELCGYDYQPLPGYDADYMEQTIPDVFLESALMIDKLLKWQDADTPPEEPAPAADLQFVSTLDDVKPDTTRWAYGIDCRCVNWYGTLFSFTGTQAACVKVLVEHYKAGVPEVAEQTILSNEWVDSSQQRLAQVFDKGKHPAWGTMIKPGGTKGTFRLVKPNE